MLQQTLVRWIPPIFRPSDRGPQAADPETPAPPAAPPRRFRLYWPFKLHILRAKTEEAAAPAIEIASTPPLDLAEIVDSLFWSGYTGTGEPEEILQRLRKMQESAVDASRVEFLLRETGLRQKIDAVGEELRQDRADEPGIRAKIDGLREARAASTQGVHQARERLLAAYARLTALRHRFPLRRIEERIRAEAELLKVVTENVAATDAVRTSVEAALLERELSRRETAGPAFAEWQAGHQERVRAIREQSERQGRVVSSLRASGMTERVAGFFVWAGYVGMIIFGWRLGDVLHQRAFPNAHSINGLIAPLAQTAYQTFLKVGTLPSLWAILAFVMVWLLGSFLIFFLFDRGLTRFDTGWKAPEDKKGAGAAQRSRSGVSYDSVFRLVSGGEVSRGDYSRYLARTPLLAMPTLLGLLALLFFAMGGQRLATNTEFVNPVNSLLFAIFGFAMAAMFTGLCALVLQPLVARRAVATAARWSTPVVVALAAALTALTVLFTGGIPHLVVWGPEALAGPVLLIVANAMMLSHGLVYRNVFRDWRALRKEATRLENEQWRMSPYSMLVPRDLKPHTLFTRCNELHEELREVWKAQDQFADDSLSDLFRPFLRPDAAADSDAAAKPGTLPSWSAEADDVLRGTRVTALDGRLEPDLTAEVVSARTEYHDAREALDDLDHRLAEAKARLDEIEGSRLEEKLSRLEGDLEKLTTERAIAEAEVETRYAALLQEGASAYENGRRLSERLVRVTTGTMKL